MCNSLTTVKFNCTKLTKIPARCFANSGLKEVVIPEGVTFIDDSFIQCEHLEKAYIPATVTEMDISFFRCPNVTVYAPAGSYAEQYAKAENYNFVAQ
jgi:hypothetical protein